MSRNLGNTKGEIKMLLPPELPVITKTEYLWTIENVTDEQYLEFWTITHNNWCARTAYAKAQVEYFTAKINERNNND